MKNYCNSNYIKCHKLKAQQVKQRDENESLNKREDPYAAIYDHYVFYEVPLQQPPVACNGFDPRRFQKP